MDFDLPNEVNECYMRILEEKVGTYGWCTQLRVLYEKLAVQQGYKNLKNFCDSQHLFAKLFNAIRLLGNKGAHPDNPKWDEIEVSPSVAKSLFKLTRHVLFALYTPNELLDLVEQINSTEKSSDTKS